MTFFCVCCSPQPLKTRSYGPEAFAAPAKDGVGGRIEKKTYSLAAMDRPDLLQIAKVYIKTRYGYDDFESYAQRILKSDSYRIFANTLNSSADREWTLAQEALYETGFVHVFDDTLESFGLFLSVCGLYGLNEQAVVLMEQNNVHIQVMA